MAYKKSRGFRKKKRLVNNPMYTSPDGGETVYQQLPNGEKILVEQTQKAKDNEQAFTEIDMVGTEAIQLRRKYPALQKAWDRYLTVWHLIHENDSDV